MSVYVPRPDRLKKVEARVVSSAGLSGLHYRNGDGSPAPARPRDPGATDGRAAPGGGVPTRAPDAPAVTAPDWRTALPVLTGPGVTLRQLRRSDAPALNARLNTEEVARFISPPPTDVAGFERFIDWTHREQAAGRYACFAVVPAGTDTAVGIFQVRELEAGFQTAEWGFVFGSAYWGTGLFAAGADLVLEFAFETLGVHRLEARCMRQNGRATGALLKVGAVPEAVLRRSFLKDGVRHDQVIWSILDEDWLRARAFRTRRAAAARRARRRPAPFLHVRLPRNAPVPDVPGPLIHRAGGRTAPPADDRRPCLAPP